MDATESNDVVVLHPAIAMTGRIMFTLIFFLSGVTHFTALDDYAKLMPAAIPFRPFWVMISGIVELIGATMIVTNKYPRLGGWLIAIFLVPVTVTVHGVLMITAPDPEMRRIQTSFFLKGVTMTGSALLITQFGVKRARSSAAR
ncbi:MAG TPA: DoxX family membrane protein [Candidatus Binatia bacterium]|nr:DoxX family membrane protein [Candidatus Binatia bacterium]